MTPLFTVTLWDGRHANAQTIHQITLPLDATADHDSDVSEGIEALTLHAADLGREAILSVGAYYQGRHVSKNWQDSNAIALEYSVDTAHLVERELQRLNLRYLMVPSLPAEKDSECETVVLFLNRRVDIQKDFTRLLALMASNIGVRTLSQGFSSCTFLFAADKEGIVRDSRDGLFVDVQDELACNDFVVAKSYERGAL